MGGLEEAIARKPVKKEPAIRLPLTIVILTLILVGLHYFTTHFCAGLSLFQRFACESSLFQFGFVPSIRALPDSVFESILGRPLPITEEMVLVLTTFTHAWLHGSWTHLIFNVLWMIIFGAAMSWRLGLWRFLILTLAGMVVGAWVYAAVNWGDVIPVVGFSGVVSAYMGAGVRCIFEKPIAYEYKDDGTPMMGHAPVRPLKSFIHNRSARSFVVIWLAMNVFFGLFPEVIDEQAKGIAWEAHLGGFCAGFWLIGLIDPVTRKCRHLRQKIN